MSSDVVSSLGSFDRQLRVRLITFTCKSVAAPGCPANDVRSYKVSSNSFFSRKHTIFVTSNRDRLTDKPTATGELVGFAVPHTESVAWSVVKGSVTLPGDGGKTLKDVFYVPEYSRGWPEAPSMDASGLSHQYPDSTYLSDKYLVCDKDKYWFDGGSTNDEFTVGNEGGIHITRDRYRLTDISPLQRPMGLKDIQGNIFAWSLEKGIIRLSDGAALTEVHHFPSIPLNRISCNALDANEDGEIRLDQWDRPEVLIGGIALPTVPALTWKVDLKSRLNPGFDSLEVGDAPPDRGHCDGSDSQATLVRDSEVDSWRTSTTTR